MPEGNLEREPEAKRRKLANVHRSKARFTQVLRLQKYDGSLQKVTKMLLDLEFGKTKDHHENVTSIVEKLAGRKDMCTPHDDDEKCADMFRDTVFVDDVNGGNELDKHLVIGARKTEMEFFKRMAVYRKVPRSEVKKQGGKIISTRWVDTDKGYKGNANYRSRLVARDNKKDKRQDLFSATPPLETLKLLVADCAKGQRQAKPLRIGIFDVSRAYFYAPVTRPLFINIPDEDWEEGDEGLVGQLQISLYGMRDAAQNWAATYTKFFVKIGFQRGRASNCNFVHKKRNIKMTVHGDDFLAVADLDQIKWIEEQLKSEYAIKAKVLEPEPELSKEIKILNRSIRWCGDKLEYEADSRHAEVIIEECEVQSWRAAKTPGVQEAAVDGSEKGGIETHDREKTRFRGVAARINYLAMDRSDLQFAAKELCRKMART